MKFEQSARHHRHATVSSANLRSLMGARHRARLCEQVRRCRRLHLCRRCRRPHHRRRRRHLHRRHRRRLDADAHVDLADDLAGGLASVMVPSWPPPPPPPPPSPPPPSPIRRVAQESGRPKRRACANTRPQRAGGIQGLIGQGWRGGGGGEGGILFGRCGWWRRRRQGSGWSGLPSPTTALASTTPIATCSTATVASAIAAASLA